VPGVASYKPTDPSSPRPKLIFKSNEKRAGPIDDAIKASKVVPSSGEYFKMDADKKARIELM